FLFRLIGLISPIGPMRPIGPIGRMGQIEPLPRSRSEPVDAINHNMAAAGPHVCKRCGVGLTPGAGDFYLVAVEAVADPTPPICSADDEAADVRRQIERLLAQLEGVSEQEALDQVYRRLAFFLCGPCFRLWIENPTG